MAYLQFRIEGAAGLPLRMKLHLPPPGSRHALVVFMHGFKGFQDWGPWGAVCDRLAQEGFAALRFDLSHNGVGDDGVAFSALDRFERNTIDAEIFDLQAVLDWVAGGAGGAGAGIDLDRVVLLGHSRGGGGVLLAAAERLGLSPAAPPATGPAPLCPRIRAIATWAAIATYERGWAVEAIALWEHGKSVPVWNKRTEQMMPLGPELYLDYLARPERYDIEAAVARLARERVPLLLVHGADDETVPVGEAARLRDAYLSGGRADDVELRVVPGGDHTFGTKHPFTDWSPALEAAFGHTLRFLRRAISPHADEGHDIR